MAAWGGLVRAGRMGGGKLRHRAFALGSMAWEPALVRFFSRFPPGREARRPRLAWAAARVRPPSLFAKETGQKHADTQIPMKWGIGPSIGDGFCPTILATGATARYTRGAFRPMTRGLLALLVPTGGTMTRPH
jgi:hypothetical protein